MGFFQICTPKKLATALSKISRKKTSLEESHAPNPIRDSGETLGEPEKSRQESRLDSWWESRQDSWQDFSRSPNVSPESRIGLYARLFVRLSPRLVFLRGVL